ncbi:MAG: hypothetical protein NTX75_16170 [Proteobacteria bacterium]|nr:hypothetical protein [Pseudomonadota bacterium]
MEKLIISQVRTRLRVDKLEGRMDANRCMGKDAQRSREQNSVPATPYQGSKLFIKLGLVRPQSSKHN